MLFVCVCWSMTIVFYTETYEIAGNRAPQWAAQGLDRFKLNAWLCFIFKLFDVYIKSYEEGYLLFWDTNMRKQYMFIC